MRTINKIIIHCTATKEGRKTTIEEVKRWHTAPKEKGGRGWPDIGYHYLILLDGTIERGRPEEVIGAHCKGMNKNSIDVCYVGGIDAGRQPKDTRTKEQKHAFKILVEHLQDRFPGSTIHGHYEFANKACPGFKIEDL